MSAYYNEIDVYAAAWLRELMKAGLITDGEIDTRSIVDVRPDDLRGFTRCHFFAGIGGWDYALQLAGWPVDCPVWTGSCPCQPFSQGGLNRGADDARHLWPVWFPLIRECRPGEIFGEQVSGAPGYSWFDLVGCDLEDIDYAVAAADLPSACIDSFHVRQRLWWAAADSHAYCVRRQRLEQKSQPTKRESAELRRSELERLVSDARRLAIPAGKYGALADGISGRMGRLRGYSNAINPHVAAEFIAAYRDVTEHVA